MDERAQGHDIIVIGASAGGVEALLALIPDLPADLPASIVIVMHVGRASHLASILQKRSQLDVRQAKAGERFQRGTVYVAGPGAHLLLHDSHILIRKGPRENMARPAIDPLFRSAAISFGGRVIGVVLSGSLNDGTAGLRAIKRCGGLAVVQEPKDAVVAEMPRSALRYVEVDYVAKIAEMADLLTRLVEERAGVTPEIPLDIRMETAIAAQELADMEIEEKLGLPSPFTCPDCGGTLWEIEDGDLLRYRCHVGHAYTADAVLLGQNSEVEHMLEGLQRANQERAALARRMAEKERDRKNKRLADLLDSRADEYEQNAEIVRQLAAGANGDSLVEEEEKRSEGETEAGREGA
ncbi:MAG TPA: chemotaxis protein CheB [Xanthobacteraceae bacterium]|nr:chemotaxis protein CheB [Xanthobacteraceae bacterium]